MKRLLIIAVILCVCVPAFGLTDSDYLRMKRRSPEFAEADRELSRVYNQAEDSMKESDFAKIRKSQRQWIANGRDRHARSLINEGYSRVEAYTEATLARVREIKNELTLSSLSTSDVAGYYDNGDDVYLYIKWLNRRADSLEVNLSSRGENWRGQGILDDDELIAEYGGTSVTLRIIDNDTIRVHANSAFRRAVGFKADDVYKRHYGK